MTDPVLHRIIMDALLEQDARTYHGESSDTSKLAAEIVLKIEDHFTKRTPRPEPDKEEVK